LAFRQFAQVVSPLVVAAILGGCGGEEKIPLKTVTEVYEVKGVPTPKSARANAGSSAGIKRDPSGMNKVQ